MSKTFWDGNGKATDMRIDDINKCKWLCDEVCCNDKSPLLADYPASIRNNMCECESKVHCEYFEKEDGIIEVE